MIVDHPVDESAATGTVAMFSVTATGELLEYQWQKDGANINDVAGTYSGTNTDSLTVETLTDPDDEGSFRVVVSNTANIVGVTSNSATLTVCEFCYIKIYVSQCLLEWPGCTMQTIKLFTFETGKIHLNRPFKVLHSLYLVTNMPYISAVGMCVIFPQCSTCSMVLYITLQYQRECGDIEGHAYSIFFSRLIGSGTWTDDQPPFMHT